MNGLGALPPPQRSERPSPIPISSSEVRNFIQPSHLNYSPPFLHFSISSHDFNEHAHTRSMRAFFFSSLELFALRNTILLSPIASQFKPYKQGFNVARTHTHNDCTGVYNYVFSYLFTTDESLNVESTRSSWASGAMSCTGDV